jgi:Putative zinc-finger
MTCKDTISFELLIAYSLGEVPEARELALEEHLFGCAHCTRRLEEIAALASGVRAAVKDGRVSIFVSEPFVQAMAQAGLRLREYRLGPGDSVNCTIRTDDDAVITRIRAPLAGVRRLDVVNRLGGAPEDRIMDVPFDAQTGEVLIVQSSAWLRTMPAFTLQTRLIAVGDVGETPLGDYTFNHSPS